MFSNKDEDVTIEIPSSLFTLPNYNSNNPETSTQSQQFSSTTTTVPPPLKSLCVLTIPEYPSLMILGDVFLQSVVVIHNLTDLSNPTVTIVPRKWSIDQDIIVENMVTKITNYDDDKLKKTLFESDINIFSSLPLKKEYIKAVEWSNRRFSSSLSINQIQHNNTLSFFSFTSFFNSINFFSNSKTLSLPTILPLHNVLGIQYVAMIEMGTPLQSNIPVIIDTGSSSLVVM